MDTLGIAVFFALMVFFISPKIMDDLSDGNVCRLIREEDWVMEAGAILAVMSNRRWM